MKVSFVDFLYCAVALVAITGLSLIAVSLVSPYLRHVVGHYYVVVNSALFLLVAGVISGLLARALICMNPLACGEFSMEDRSFTYWKFLTMNMDIGTFLLKPFTLMALRPCVMKLYGAKIGSNVAIGGRVEDPFLITIGNNSILGNQSLVCGNVSAQGKITFGKVVIGNEVTIGANSIVMPNVTIGDCAVVGMASVILPGTVIPPGEHWRGNPARKWQ